MCKACRNEGGVYQKAADLDRELDRLQAFDNQIQRFAYLGFAMESLPYFTGSLSDPTHYYDVDGFLAYASQYSGFSPPPTRMIHHGDGPNPAMDHGSPSHEKATLGIGSKYETPRAAKSSRTGNTSGSGWIALGGVPDVQGATFRYLTNLYTRPGHTPSNSPDLNIAPMESGKIKTCNIVTRGTGHWEFPGFADIDVPTGPDAPWAQVLPIVNPGVSVSKTPGKAIYNAYDEIVVSGGPTGGTWRIRLREAGTLAQWTLPLPYNATADDVAAGMLAASMAGGNLLATGNFAVVRTGSGTDGDEYRYTVTYFGTLAGTGGNDTGAGHCCVGNVDYALTGGDTSRVDFWHTNGRNASKPRMIFSANSTGATWQAVFMGQATGPIARGASAADVQTALEALSTIGAGNVVVTRTGTNPHVYTCELVNWASTGVGHNQLTYHGSDMVDSATWGLGIVGSPANWQCRIEDWTPTASSAPNSSGAAQASSPQLLLDMLVIGDDTAT